MRLIIPLFLLIVSQCSAQQAISVDASQDRRAINPGVYGINFYWSPVADAASRAAAADVRATVRRWGGNNTSRYNWKLDVQNIDADWFFEVLPGNLAHPENLPDGSSFNQMMDQVRTTGGTMVSTMPILGWTPKARSRMCSYAVSKYGPQCKTDPYWSDCGNGQKADCKTSIVNDPHDANVESDTGFGRDWVKYLITRYGPAAQGGVAYWSLDNEPIWWSGTHQDIHPAAQEYDETLAKGLLYARAIKDADPGAMVTGPVSAGWESMYFSLKDCNAGWNSRGVNGGADWQYWNNPVDRKAHSGLGFVPWYLTQFKTASDQAGVRLLDVLDLHAYIAPGNLSFSSRGNAATEKLRLTSTRVFWDPNYVASWLPNLDDVTSKDYGKPVAPMLVPRMRKWVADYFPGLQTAITEYNWGAAESITGALAQADILGIFGREGLDIGTLWGPTKPTDPLAFAFRMYRNYDGIGGNFGETSVRAVSPDPDTVSVFAAQRSDSSVTVMLLNKTTADQAVTLSLAGIAAAGQAQLWRYSEANLKQIVRMEDVAVDEAGGISITLPAYSLNLLVVAQDPQTITTPAPAIQSVSDSASGQQAAIAPGQEVVVAGVNLGSGDGSTGGLRILFDGVAAPVWSAGGGSARVTVPYFGATKTTTHVVAEYLGVRSDAVVVNVAATAPGLFTVDGSGAGQAVAINMDDGTANSADAPVAAGSAVVLIGTGEGVTDPPGVDGRPATDVIPRPVAQCSAKIGGIAAVVDGCRAVANQAPGRFQLRAFVDAAVTPGSAVPVVVTVGGVSSQAGVTIAVK